MRRLGSAGAGVRFRTIKEPLSEALAKWRLLSRACLEINVLLCQYMKVLKEKSTHTYKDCE